LSENAIDKEDEVENGEENGEEENEEEEDDEKQEDDEQQEELQDELEAFQRVVSKQKKTIKPSINNEQGLKEKLEEITLKLPGGKLIPWIESFTMTTEDPVLIEDVHDDLQREMAFYTVSVAAVKEAHSKLDQLGISYKRPNDYFAEMLKSDSHMSKLKTKLLEEKQRIEKIEERKQQREQKKNIQNKFKFLKIKKKNNIRKNKVKKQLQNGENRHEKKENSFLLNYWKMIIKKK